MDTTVNTALSLVAFSQAGQDQLIAAAQVSPLGEAEAGDGVWIKIMPSGSFTGRDGRGPFHAGDIVSMQAIIDASLKAAGSIDIMIDYDHQSFYGVREGVAGTAKAAGWFVEFRAQEDGIYSKVKWTTAAAELIRNREYRYISPLFAADPKSGQVRLIKNAGLVNQPALDIPAVAANLQTEGSEDMKSIAKLLGLPEDATEAQIAAAITKLLDGRTTVAASLNLDQAVEFDAIATAVSGVRTAVSDIAVAAGLKADAKSDEIVAAVKAKAAGEVDGSQYVPMSMFTDLQTKLTALEIGTAEKAVTEAVDDAIEQGKVTPANKEWAMSYAAKDLDGFKQFAAKAPKLTTAQLGERTPNSGDDKHLSEDEKLVAASLGLTDEAFVAARAKDK